MVILSLKNIHYAYGSNVVLKDISYDFEEGKTYCIKGKSGAGKTILLSLLSALAPCDEGSILYNGKDIKELDQYVYRSQYIGVIFQSYNLITKFTALENVMLSMDIANVKRTKKKLYHFYTVLD